jgi:integrase
MGLYYSLNYQKPKSEYNSTDEIPIILYYYHEGKKTKLSTGVKVQLKYWNGSGENPVKRSDSEHKFKNLRLKQFHVEIENIIQRIHLNNQNPDSELIKIHLNKLKKKRTVETKKDFDYFLLRNEYDNTVLKDVRLTHNYRRNVVNSLNQISEFISNHLKLEYLPLSDFDDEFQKEYLNYSVNTKKRRNPTIHKHLKHLIGFIKWCNKNGYTERVIQMIPITTNFDYEVIYLNREEVYRLYKFEDFEFTNPKHLEYTKEYITDEIKGSNTVKYSNLEVYKDMLVFGCGVGCRFGDLVSLRLDNYQFGKNRNEGYFVFRMEKSRIGKQVKVPVNRLTFSIWKKYSKNKKREDYLFPQTSNGNLISNQKMNQHLKIIGEIIGLNRLVSKPSYSPDGKVIEGTDIRKPLYKFLTTHIIRRTFIREGIESNIPIHVIMSMSGHTSEKVFRNYFSTTKSELDYHGSKLFSYQLSDKIESSLDNSSIESDLLKLKSLYDKGLIPKSFYDDKIEEYLG